MPRDHGNTTLPKRDNLQARYPEHPDPDSSQQAQLHLHPNQPSPYDESTHPSTPSTPQPLSAAAKKKHVCVKCDRSFTTSGHLARHARIHTGERNHKCPFPGCETRCSRQDNLQQHYRIHLSPGSRRNSGSATRAAMTRAMGTEASRSGNSRRRRKPILTPPPAPPSPVPSPPLEAPPLEQAHQLPSISAPLPEPPDTPPLLTQAYLPVAMAPAPLLPQPPRVSSRSSTESHSDFSYRSPLLNDHVSLPPSSHSHSPEFSYSPSHASRTSSSLGRVNRHDSYWQYDNQVASSYQQSEQVRPSPTSRFHYTHNPGPPSPSLSIGHARGHGQASSDEGMPYYSQYEVRRANTSPVAHQSSLPLGASTAMQYVEHQQALYHSSGASSSSRHSIAHISHPQQPPSPPSPDSVSPEHSHPPTPSYALASMPGYAESQSDMASPLEQRPPPEVGLQNAQYESGSLASAGYSQPQPQHAPYSRLPALHSNSRYSPPLHFSYTAPNNQPYQNTSNGSALPRYYSPPPVLAPIQNERVVRGDLDSVYLRHSPVPPAPYSQASTSNHTYRPPSPDPYSEPDSADVPTGHYLPVHHPVPQHAAASHAHQQYLHSGMSLSAWRMGDIRGRGGLVQ